MKTKDTKKFSSFVLYEKMMKNHPWQLFANTLLLAILAINAFNVLELTKLLEKILAM